MEQQRLYNCIFKSSPFCLCSYDAKCVKLTYEHIYGIIQIPLTRSTNQKQYNITKISTYKQI